MKSGEIRTRILPAGWYPRDEEELQALLEEWEMKEETTAEKQAVAAVAPHAGWAFSGHLAYRTLRELNRSCDTVVVVGGHLPGGAGTIAAREAGFETPRGTLENDREFLELLEQHQSLGEDMRPDNTVEVQLPFLHAMLPDIKAVWLRTGNGDEAIELGKALAAAEKASQRRIRVVGSTDLTHYGPAYGFTPKGVGEESYTWARDENDAGIIERMLDFDASGTLDWGNDRQAACSSGAAAAAISYARERGCGKARLIGYANSYQFRPDDSFVGYAGVIYSSEAS
jgi:AmmeMemoRadiSam system protein B